MSPRACAWLHPPRSCSRACSVRPESSGPTSRMIVRSGIASGFSYRIMTSRSRRGGAGPAAVAAGAFLLAAAAACRAKGPAGGARAAGRDPAPNAFAADRTWDDGKAEIDAYEAKERRYGIARPFTAYM